MTNVKRVTMLVLDSAGVGALPDAADYGDVGTNTLGNLAKAAGGLNLPNMEKMGLGNIIDIEGVSKVELTENSAYGKLAEASVGKDTTIGHWEIAGVVTSEPFPSYPNGFPDEILDEFKKRTGRGVIGNCVASGTTIIADLGDKHVETGDLIVYTSADSVFQIAAHEEVVPLEKLYEYCEIAREITTVGRVIARPFVGTSGNYSRTTNRHDYSLEPTGETILDRVKAAGKDVIAIGKISDIYAGVGVTESVRTQNNMDGVDRTLEFLKKENEGMIFTNLVDFDMHYGHRRDVAGYKKALEDFDKRLPEIISAMNDDDVLIMTADHGCDPTYKGTDHTREYVPVLVYGKPIKGGDVGVRNSFAEIAHTIDSLLLNDNSRPNFSDKMR